MKRALAILASLLAFSAVAAVQPRLVVTGQVTAVYSNLHVLQGLGRPVCVHGAPRVLRRGDLVVETCRRIESGVQGAWWESVALETVGRADPPPPSDITLEALLRDRPFFTPIRTEGIVEDIQQDDTALDSFLLTLRSGSSRIQVTFSSEERRHIPDFDKLLNAKIVLTGVYFDRISSSRPFHGPVFVLTDAGSIRIIESNPADLFSLPALVSGEATAPADIAELGLRTLSGTVLACWERKHVLLKSNLGLHRLTLAFGVTPPPVGSSVQIVGQPETDYYRINFTSVRYRRRAGAPSATDERACGSVNEGLSKLFHVAGGKTVYHDNAYGRLFRVRGTLTSRSDTALSLLVGEFPVEVDATSCPDVLSSLRPGSVLGITGVCVHDIDNWRPGTFQPPTKGYRLVLRDARDLSVVRVPSWWTPARLGSVIAGLLALLVGSLVWNRMLNRLVIRRSRELLRERLARLASDLRIGERTRLAVELHDSLSQNLTGVTFQIASAQNAIGTADDTAKARLETAGRILKSCHAELRNVLSDLRSSALEERDFSAAVRLVLKELSGNAAVDVRFDVPRARIPDSTAHALLCIVRELVANAVRHGQASRISVTGMLADGTLTCTVKENGRGFDPAHRPGPSQGHFGLDGIRTRVGHLSGTFEIASSPGHGSQAVLTLPIRPNADTNPT